VYLADLLLKTGTVVDDALIAGPTSTKNKDKARNPKMHSNKKGYQRYFGWKAHIGADAECGLVHTLRGTSVDIAEANA
jgi:IS5 family transposase